MTLDRDLLNQAYYLFVEEALELLDQIQDGLLELHDDPSLSHIHSLMKTVYEIENGAAQVHLIEIQNLAHRLENALSSLWQEQIAIDANLIDGLGQAYECLRQALLAQIQTNPEEIAEVLVKSEAIFTRLEAQLNPQLEIEPAIAAEPEAAITSPFLHQEVVQALENLEAVLSIADVDRQREALKTQVEGLLRLGEVLKISEFVAIAQITLATLQATPQTSQTIGNLALAGFRSAQASVFQNLNEVLQGFAPTSEILLNTDKLLVWLVGTAALIVSSDSVEEILLLQPDQLVEAKMQQLLPWRDQMIPVYSLSQLLTYHYPLPEVSCQNLSPSSRTTALAIINHGEQICALALAIEGLVTESPLKIKPFGSAIAPPAYCYGCILLDNNRLTLAINTVALLNQVIEPSARQTPTILAIDDSNTLRQMVVLTLEKAGYRVLQARDGWEGIQQMRQNPTIQLVISDIEMPNLNGFGFLKCCRQDPQLAKIPVVLLSTYYSEQHRHLATQLGASAYLTKPYQEPEFLTTIQSLIK